MADSQVNGPRTMYKSNPFYDSSEPLQLPDCMYKVQSYYTYSNDETQMEASSQEDTDSEVKALEQWQESILTRLGALKQEVDQLSAARGISSESIAAATSAAASVAAAASAVSMPKAAVVVGKASAEEQNAVLRDLVISADPRSPPLSLLVLYRLLCEQGRVLPACHVHSSVTAVPDRLRSIFSMEATLDRDQYQTAFTLVWKDEKHGPSLMVSPQTQTRIQGEANVARYLARLLPAPYDDNGCHSIITATEIDSLVDLAHTVTRGNNKERAAVLRTLNARLGKAASWLVGSEVSLADVVLWGAITAAGLGDGAPANVRKWLDRCGEVEAFKFALQAL